MQTVGLSQYCFPGITRSEWTESLLGRVLKERTITRTKRARLQGPNSQGGWPAISSSYFPFFGKALRELSSQTPMLAPLGKSIR